MSKPDSNGDHSSSAGCEFSPNSTERALRHWLDAQTESLDTSTLQQLGRARRAAIGELAQQARRRPRWITGAAAASVCVALLFAAQLAPLRSAAVPPAPASMETFSMLASPDSEDMLESLDFYLWLESQERETDDLAG